jgi:hypothetical protein
VSLAAVSAETRTTTRRRHVFTGDRQESPRAPRKKLPLGPIRTFLPRWKRELTEARNTMIYNGFVY